MIFMIFQCSETSHGMMMMSCKSSPPDHSMGSSSFHHHHQPHLHSPFQSPYYSSDTQHPTSVIHAGNPAAVAASLNAAAAAHAAAASSLYTFQTNSAAAAAVNVQAHYHASGRQSVSQQFLDRWPSCQRKMMTWRIYYLIKLYLSCPSFQPRLNPITLGLE